MNVIPSIYQYNRLGLISGGFSPSRLDPDAAAYIAAVESADGQALEGVVKIAYNSFIKGCKSDGIWDAIKASCILAGARTLDGALVSLKGTAPTNYNFVSGDYNRETGLIGDGSTKYLDSNRNNNADPQDSQHLSVWVSTANSIDTTRGYIGSGISNSGSSHIATASSSDAISLRSRSSSFSFFGSRLDTGFVAISRASSSEVTARSNESNETSLITSQTPLDQNIAVFGRNLTSQTDGRLAFYSIGEALDLELLDSRVSTLINRLRFSITTGEDWRNYDPDAIAYIVKLFDSGVTYV